MSLITQCPACSTMFRVVPDQLRISEGWVRCGQCDEVFDANAHMRSPLGPGSAAAAAPAAPLPAAALDTVPPDAIYAATAMLPLQAEAESADAAPAHEMPAEEEPVLAAPSDAFLDYRPQELPAEEDAADSQPDEANGHSIFPATVMASLDAGEQQEVYASVEDAPAPSFMAQAAGPRAANRWLGKKTLLALCAGLLLLLALQGLLLERDRMAASTPALRPGLALACEALGCTIAPLREIESIAIDSSAFTSVRAGVYLLNVTLKNAAAVELATPALELTLTDSQDRPVLRRVVLPAELGSKKPLAAGLEWSASLPIGVQVEAAAEKIAGYKLLAFYP